LLKSTEHLNQNEFLTEGEARELLQKKGYLVLANEKRWVITI
jgi:hypothetical protein